MIRCLSILITLLLVGCFWGEEDSSPRLTTKGFAEDTPIYRRPIGSEVTVMESIAEALIDSGVKRLSFAPAVGVTTIAEVFSVNTNGSKLEQVSRPETALALAIGDSICGTRSAVVLGGEQFIAISGELLQAALWGCNAGSVVVVITDDSGRYSSTFYNAESVAGATNLPSITATATSIYSSIQDAMLTSEMLGMPFVVLIDIDSITKPVASSEFQLLTPYNVFSKNIYRNVLTPALSTYHNRVLDAKKMGNDASVVEPPKLPVMPNDLPRRFKTKYTLYQPIISVVAELSPRFVAGEGGDISMFAFAPYELISAVGFSGSAVPLAERAARNGSPSSWAIMSGDDFVRNAISIAEVINLNSAPIKILVLNSGEPESAGANPLSQNMLDSTLKLFGEQVTRISTEKSRSEVKDELEKLSKSPYAEIMVIDY